MLHHNCKGRYSGHFKKILKIWREYVFLLPHSPTVAFFALNELFSSVEFPVHSNNIKFIAI